MKATTGKSTPNSALAKFKNTDNKSHFLHGGVKHSYGVAQAASMVKKQHSK